MPQRCRCQLAHCQHSQAISPSLQGMGPKRSVMKKPQQTEESRRIGGPSFLGSTLPTTGVTLIETLANGGSSPKSHAGNIPQGGVGLIGGSLQDTVNMKWAIFNDTEAGSTMPCHAMPCIGQSRCSSAKPWPASVGWAPMEIQHSLSREHTVMSSHRPNLCCWRGANPVEQSRRPH